MSKKLTPEDRDNLILAASSYVRGSSPNNIKLLGNDHKFCSLAGQRHARYRLFDQLNQAGQPEQAAEILSTTYNLELAERYLPVVVNTPISSDDRAAAFAFLVLKKRFQGTRSQ